MNRLTTDVRAGHFVGTLDTPREPRHAGSVALCRSRSVAGHLQQAPASGYLKAALLFVCLLVSPATSPAAVSCDITWPATLTANNQVLSMLSSGTAQLLFRLPGTVGTSIHLGLTFSGTAQNGVDVEALPTSVLIPGNQSSVALTVKPKPNYPFASKTLTVTLSSSDYLCVVPGSPNSVTINLIGFDPPRLEAARPDSNHVALSWWAPVPGYLLQSASEPVSTNWSTVVGAPLGVQGSNTFTLTKAGSAQFYRLTKP